MDAFEKVCKLEHNDELGRYVAAAANIKAGETVLLESPVIIMPVSGEKRCANCFKIANKFCSLCYIFPLCDNCNQHNEFDCKLIAEMKNLQREKLQLHYEIYGPLKCLLLKENDATMSYYEMIIQQEAHNEERRDTKIWLENKQNIIDPILSSGLIEQLKHKDTINEELLQHICSTINVNCFEIRAPDGNAMRGVYPKAALFAHQCVANVTIAIDDQYQMKIYANRDISAGEMICVSYTSPLLGTDERRQFLKIGKYFHCTCPRCEDPTELGSHMSSIRCKFCASSPKGKDEGYLVKRQNKWHCQLCDHTMEQSIVDNMLTVAKEEIFFAKDDIRKYELLIMKLSRYFHTNHYLIVDLKQNVAAILRSIILNMSCRPGKKVYERKVQLCEEILSVLRIVQPDFSRFKAIALYELYNSFAELSRLRFGENELSDMELLEHLQQAESMLRESLGMLIYEPVNTPEGALARNMFKELKDLQNDMKLLRTQSAKNIIEN